MGYLDKNPSEELVFRVLTGRARDTEKEKVVAWRRRAEANESRYQEMARMLRLTACADVARGGGGAPQAGTVVSRAIAEMEHRPSRPRFISGLPARGRWAAGLVLSGAVAAGMVLWTLGMFHSGPDVTLGSESRFAEFVTGMSESASVGLADGTVVRLAPTSRLKVLLDEDARKVVLTGRAYFAVARDESRPFLVQTTAGDVTVLGTRFTLEANGDDLRVVVVEGQVSLTGHGEDTAVRAGEMGRVVRGRPVPAVKVSDPQASADWVGRFLAFQETPFRDAATEIGRQYGVEFEVHDVLAGRTITAWFSEWTLEDVLEVVCPVVHAECTTESGWVRAAPLPL